MAPKSLLRHFFRHGPRRNALPAQSNRSDSPEPKITRTKQPPSPLNRALTAEVLLDSPLAYKSGPNSLQLSVLEDIAEESNSDTDSNAAVDNNYIAEALAALYLDIGNFTTRDLILSTVDEARLAIHAHIDTINTTLALLEALEGFSATITILRDEMIEKKRVCEEKLGMLEEVDWAVRQMQFRDE